MNTKGFSPFVGMDALRAFNKINKSLFDVHTKRYSGFTDEYGIQYAGTVENFGSELLLEPRKLLMDKLPIGDIFTKDTMSFYFDIDYSGYVNTYDQQNMLCAKLKKDVLLSNKEYFIYFEDVEKVYIPRSRSSSASDVYRDAFYVTTTPPKMIIYNEDVSSSSEVDLILTDNTNNPSKYYFHVGVDTNDIVDSIDEENHTILTKALSYKMIGFSFIWFTCDALKTLPDIGFVNNEYYNDSPILTIGNNGHDGATTQGGEYYGGDALVFPYMNGDSCINYTSPNKWFLKVIPADDTAYDTYSGALKNYLAEIKEIHLVKYSEERDIPDETPDVDILITYDHEYSKMMLFAEDRYHSHWSFTETYAYAKLSEFISNSYETAGTILNAGFSIAFDDKYHFPNEDYLLNTFTGIHVDNNGDLSDNGIDKKYGTIHGLGDFDGLPPYFKYMINESLHRAHVEMYSIRDKQDDVNQTILDKQVAGIIIDSAMPKMTSPEVPANAHTSIIYDLYTPDEIKYIWNDRVPPINSRNYLSEITYDDKWVFGNSTMQEYRTEEKFIYHGNGVFSLDIVDDLSPIDEYGRVYIISNDPIIYDNNATSDNPKAPRTFARICDIPTNYSQLVGIHGLVPIFVADTDYIRTECNFTTNDKDVIYNLTGLNHWLGAKTVEFSGHVYSFPVIFPNTQLGAPLDVYFQMVFPKYKKINGRISIDFDHTLSFSVDDISGYSDLSELRIYIGGYGIDFVVHNDGQTQTLELKASSVPYEVSVPRTNFPNIASPFNTHLIHGSFSGQNEAVITITVSQSAWDNSAMYQDGMLNTGFLFRFDENDNVWGLDLEDHETYYSFSYNQKLTGEDMYINRYDSYMNNNSDEVAVSFMYNTINPIGNTFDLVSNKQTNRIDTIIPHEEDITDTIDYSRELNKSIINTQDSFYVLHKEETGNHTAISIEKCHIDDAGVYSLKHPINSDLNLSEYTNKSNRLRMTNTSKLQPSLVVYDPSFNKRYTYNDSVSISNMKVISESRDLEFTDFMSEDFYNGNKAKYNIYRYNEFDSSRISNYLANLKTYDRATLLDILNEQFKDSDILKNPDDFSNSYIIDYIIQNTLSYDIAGSYYTDNPNSTVYRRNNISLFATKDTSLIDKDFSGDMITITDDIFNQNIRVDNISSNAIPLFVYKIDIDDEITDDSFEGFRMYDEEGNDISEYCLLIINMTKYVASINEDTIKWIKSN